MASYNIVTYSNLMRCIYEYGIYKPTYKPTDFYASSFECDMDMSALIYLRNCCEQKFATDTFDVEEFDVENFLLCGFEDEASVWDVVTYSEQSENTIYLSNVVGMLNDATYYTSDVEGTRWVVAVDVTRRAKVILKNILFDLLV